MIRKGLLLSSIPLALTMGLGGWGYSAADPGARFPVHFGIDGQPDRWGGALEAFLGLPAIAVLLTLVFAVLPLLDPRGANLRRSSNFYLTAWIATLWFMAVLNGAITASALGYIQIGSDLLARIGGCGVSFLMLIIGNVMGKSRPNWFVGVRTPWTLSSDIAWEKTNRLGGRLFVLIGIVGALASWLLPASIALPGLFGALITAAAATVVYSWLVWREAPDRRTGPQVLEH
ncbi:MAG: SdpI family protein [Caulobacteraceae bacterium]|nr:SdpI family protein [Caulobacteraceae bacterium]